MESSIADELYSEILKMSSIELDPVADNAIHDSYGSDGDDIWNDDEDMERQWQKRHEQFHAVDTIGYREGLMTGKEVSAQEGFNVGFKESVFVGQTWGLVRGVTSALVCLPDALKERLVETEDKRNKLQQLHESVSAISTTDALKLFYERLNHRSTEEGDNAQTSSHVGDLHGQSSDEDVLENHVREFNKLVLECSAIDVHLHNEH